MPTYIGLLEPKKHAQKNGAVTLVYALEAPNKKAAEGIIVGKLWEAYPAAGENFFNPKVVEDQPGCPRPALGVFDEQFAIENEFDVDGKCWVPREVEAPPTGPVDLMKQPANVRIAAVVMYGEGEIDNGQLSLVVDMLDDEDTPDDTGMRAVIDALVSVTQVGAMYPSAVYRLVSAIFEQAGDAVPAEADVLAFAQEWVSNPNEREKIKLGSHTSTSTEGSGGVPDYNTLSMHTALSIMAVHPATAKAGDVKNAKEIIASRDSVWRAWDKTYRVITGILDVDTDTRHSIISDGLKNLKLVNNDDERLHFVKTRLAGNPACPELANYGQQPDPQPEVESLGGGKFSVGGLTGEQPITTSNEGEKEEVDAVNDLAATTRSAWLRREIMTALDGKTSVMSVADVKELLANIGDLNHVYIARLLAKEIEPCDPFKQLREDDIYHLTCDVLEGWIHEKDERIDLLNERIEFYLKEARQTLEQTAVAGQHKNAELARADTSSVGEKTEVATTEPVSDAAALQAKEALDNLGYGVYATETEQKSELLQRAEDNAAAAAQLVQQLHADDFQQRANQVEQALADQPQEDRDNLGIWNRVYKTDAKFTKAFANNGGGTSINGTYMVMQATKVFGPHGINWGVDVLEERFDNGAPIMQPIKQPDGSFVKGIVSNGTGGYLCEVNHTVKIRLWYKQDGKTGEVLAYGCTPYIYGTKNGAMSDGEAPKKSLTDATKKALSQLGFSADVFLGLYDDVNYREENDAEFALKNASEKAEGVTRLREELDEKLTKVAETISKAVTVNEANKVHASIAREVDAHRKAFEAKGDTEHAKYLAGRLRRLTTLKDERIKALSASEEKTQ